MTQFMTTERVRTTLKEAFALLDGCFEWSPRELALRPEYPDAWSAAEHLEHVCLANHFLLLTIAKGCRTARRRAAAGAQLPAGESDLELLSEIAVPGAFPWPPPLHMAPSGRRPLEQVRGELAAQGQRCLELLDDMAHGEGRLYGIRMSVHGVGRLDMYQWLYFLAQHVRYHLALIDERRRGNDGSG